MRVEHCNGKRRATAYWLKPRQDFIDYEILLEANCPKCGKLIMEVRKFSYDKGLWPPQRIQYKHQQDWQVRKQVDLVHMEQPVVKNSNPQNTRQTIYVGDCTLEMAKDPAVVYPKIRQRFAACL